MFTLWVALCRKESARLPLWLEFVHQETGRFPPVSYSCLCLICRGCCLSHPRTGCSILGRRRFTVSLPLPLVHVKSFGLCGSSLHVSFILGFRKRKTTVTFLALFIWAYKVATKKENERRLKKLWSIFFRQQDVFLRKWQHPVLTWTLIP